ncbi:MAG: Fic family protein [Coriobacteriia bacterium]|nr:Fic family protein [Coriobacteriia bacterium]
MSNRAGTLTKNLSGEAEFESFNPSPLPPDPPLDLNADLITSLMDANKQIALLDSKSLYIPSIKQFVSMYVRKEALMSSQIEGTQATLEDVLDPSKEKNANQDVADVINYINATEFAIERLKELPLCTRLIKEVHAELMQNTRGQEKSPGEFRRSQNWIGGAGSTLKNAIFIPPSPDDMVSALSDLDKYMNNDNEYDALIRTALIHYQFETIHPFLDGNGRIGRLLITLYLIEQRVLSMPALYISYYLKKNRVEYYDRLSDVRDKGSFEQWVTFFLRAVFESAKDATIKIDVLSALHDKNTQIIRDMGRASRTSLRVIAYLEENPIIEIQKTADDLDLAYNTVSRSVERLIEVGILAQANNKSRNRVFEYTAYLDVLRDGT